MHRSRRLWVSISSVALALSLVGGASGETFVWIDDAGVTHLTDDPKSVPPSLAEQAPATIDGLRSVWGDELEGPPPVTPPGSSGRPEDRVVRLLNGALHDLGDGEIARAAATLRGVLELDPTRPEAHWHLALLDGQRGRYESAERHLHAFLGSAGPRLGAWRDSAERRLAALEDERRLADETLARGRLELQRLDSPNFRLQVDSELSAGRAEYTETVLRYLEEARADVSRQVGVTPMEPLGVVFYGKAAYLRAHRHRFSFQTVGFFDGRIHVSSPAHPSGGLRSLLFHEYTHAVFRDQTGGDRPYWLNEGLAERIERLSRRQPITTRTERAALRARIEDGSWIPLRKLAPSFAGLSDEDARAAYLESVAAVEWIEGRSDADTRRRLLERIGEGFSIDQALYETLGVDTDALEAALQTSIRSEFPTLQLPAHP